MKSLKLVLCFTLLCYSAFSQCLQVNISAPDSVCSHAPVQVSVNGTVPTGSTINWNFTSGQLAHAPVFQTNTAFGGALVNPNGFDIVEENGSYYGIVANLWSDIVLLNFGNSPLNHPTATVINGIGQYSTYATDVTLIRFNNEWHGFMTSKYNQLIRLDFGPSITNLTPTVTVITNGAPLDGPYFMNFHNYAGHYYASIANINQTTVTLYDFGFDPLTNTPANRTISVGSGNPVACDLIKSCDSLFCFVTYLSSGAMTRLDFDSSITSTPTITTLNGSLSYGPARSYQMQHDNGKWYGYAVPLNGGDFTRIEFGTDFRNTSPTFTNLGTCSGSFANATDFKFKRINDEWYLFVADVSGSTFNVLNHPKGIAVTPATATDSSSMTISCDTLGTMQVELTIENNSGIYISGKDMYVAPLPTPAFISGAACLGSSVTFTNASTIPDGSVTSSSWDFGDTQTSTAWDATNTYASAGTYTVVLTANSNLGCSDTVSQTITVHTPPTANFTFTNNSCMGSAVPLTNTTVAGDGAITATNWNFGDTSSDTSYQTSHAYHQDGNFTVTLTVSDAYQCTDSLSQQLTVEPAPVAAYTAVSTCLGDTVQFGNLTTVTNGLSLSYNWTFGDNTTSTQTHPVHAYPVAAATYQTVLVATAGNGCTDTLSLPVRISNKPIPNFTTSRDTACKDNAILFTDQSFIAAGDTISAVSWDFGDASPAVTGSSVSHAYAQPGIYHVTLTAHSPTWCEQSITKTIVVINSPDAAFTTTNVCFGAGTPFTDASVSPAGSVIDQWHWNFGDGDTAITPTATHTYAQPGNYTVQLLVTSSKGCFDTISQQVTVHNLPVVSFGFGKACTGTPVNFTDSSTVANSTVAAWAWDFNNGQTSNQQHPSATFINPFAYPVKLVAISAYGCRDSLVKMLPVNQSPQFSISAADNCVGSSSFFHYSGAANSGWRYNWLFGDSTSAAASSPTHVYSSPGIYAYSLMITDIGNGCAQSHTDTIEIHAYPHADFSTDSGCVYTDLHLINQSTIGNGESINSWTWSHKYGTSTGQQLLINLAAADSFPVKLVVQSAFGCKDSIVKATEIYPKPVVAFTPDPYYGAPPMDVQFNNYSSAGSASWDFGDGSGISSLFQPMYTYTDTGSFSVLLVMTSPRGCIDSTRKSVLVRTANLNLSLQNINFSKKNGFWELSCTVRNLGNIDITSFAIDAQLQGRSLFNEQFSSDTILPGKTRAYTFNTRFSSENGMLPEYLCMTITEVNKQTETGSGNKNICITTREGLQLFDPYPNPAFDQLQFSINNPDGGELIVHLYNAHGQEMRQATTYTLEQGYTTLTYPVSELGSGFYTLLFDFDGKRYNRSFSKY